jgi:hypothetical protein
MKNQNAGLTVRLLRVVLLTLLAANIFVGCGDNPATKAVKPLFKPSADKDVTKDPRYNFSPFVGTIWKTKTKTAIVDMKRYTGAHDIALLPPEFFDPKDPDYSRHTPIPDLKIITVLPPGTRVRITRLMQDQGAAGGVHVEALIEGGTNSQTTAFLDSYLIAENWWNSRGPTTNTNWSGDPRMLETP